MDKPRNGGRVPQSRLSITDPLRRPRSTTSGAVRKSTVQPRASSTPAVASAAARLSKSPTPDDRAGRRRFAVVVSHKTRPQPHPRSADLPRNAMSTSPTPAAAAASTASASKSSGRDVNEIVGKAHRELLTLFYLRQIIQKSNADVEAHGPGVLDTEKTKRLKWVLSTLAYHRFLDGDFKESKIGKAVQLLARPDVYGTDTSDMARKLLSRWESGDFAPASINAELDEVDESEDEEEAPGDAGSTATNLLRGIIVERGNKISRVLKLDPKYPKTPCDRFGHNGLQVGDWWPYQICALRDGAHGSRMGGIYGRVADGAFSIVVSGAYDDNDRDRGDVLYYSGSRGGEEDKLRHEHQHTENPEAILSRSTKCLIVSWNKGNPVRVLRSFQCNSRWSPTAGIRYDGLYRVVSYSQEQNRNGELYYQFELRRLPDQPPIDQSRPTPREIAQTERLRGHS